MAEPTSPQNPPPSSAPRKKSALDSLLSLFTDVHPGESPTALLLSLNVFLLLAAYYIIKPVREALILTEAGGAQAKSYLGAVIAVAMFVVVPLYSRLVNHYIRSTLVSLVTGFFIACLVGFWALSRANVPYLGYVFFVWIAIFNVMVIAQFWGFASDVYKSESGKRLFPVIAFGGNLGAVLGPKVADQLFELMETHWLMLVAGAVLAVCIVLTIIIARREFGAAETRPKALEESRGFLDGFDLLVRYRYLGLIALLVLCVNLVNTTGEFILGSLVEDRAKVEADAKFNAPAATAVPDVEAAPATAPSEPAAPDEQKKEFTKKYVGSFFANFFFWVNLTAALLQLFVVSRLVKYGGVQAALLVLPLIALGTYGLIATIPALAFVRIGKIAENGTNYSIQKTGTQMLFLPTATHIKYKATQAADAFMQRIGDVSSALIVLAGTQVLALSFRGFALVNLALVVVWLIVVFALSRENRKVEAGEVPDLTRAR